MTSFTLLAEHLPHDVSYNSKDGLYAEKSESGEIRHLGYYRDGQPSGWSLTLGQGQMRATKIETVLYPHPDDSEDELTDEDVLSWVGRICGLSGGNQICSFCAKTNLEVAKLIAGPESYICNECVELCHDILATDLAEED